MMRVAVVALILAVAAIVILAISDALAPSGIGHYIDGPGALLLCIPISLALFFFLAHKQSERHKFKEQETPEADKSAMGAINRPLQPKE